MNDRIDGDVSIQLPLKIDQDYILSQSPPSIVYEAR